MTGELRHGWQSGGVRALLRLSMGHNHSSGNVPEPDLTVQCDNAASQAPGVIFVLNGPACLTTPSDVLTELSTPGLLSKCTVFRPQFHSGLRATEER